ncbi:ferrochelatase [Marinisporobacter balticus]|uniref:Ferrochelatase n=1 Tax=Marinisporobacter balticus TaxID=2018667 RepID=A0A4V6NPH8_9FIRM|nr:ferrochelatase [Marinisporobacter balticus]TCO79320.1 ferrochelatase [Marinisporobacter balticus]
MKIIENMKIFFLPIIFTVFIIGYFVSFGFFERFSIVMLTIFSYTFFKNVKSVKIRSLCIGITGMIIGAILCSYGLFFFKYENDNKKEPINMDENINTAVLLVFDGEPEKYDLSILLKNMHRNNGVGHKICIPFRLYGYKSVYEHVGISKYNDISKRVGEKIATHLEGDYDVYVSYLNNTPYYKEVLNGEIRKENYKKMIVAPIFLTESVDYKYVVNELEMENLYTPKTRIKFMPPLWDSEKIVNEIVKDVCNMDTRKNEVGIVLMGNRDGMNQNRVFREKIKKQLVHNGYVDRKIKCIGISPDDTQIKNILGELQQYGVAKILLIGVNDIVDKVKDQYEIEEIIKKFKDAEDTDIKYMKGWGENDGMIEELEFRIRVMNVEEWDE